MLARLDAAPQTAAEDAAAAIEEEAQRAAAAAALAQRKASVVRNGNTLYNMRIYYPIDPKTRPGNDPRTACKHAGANTSPTLNAVPSPLCTV